MGLFDYDNSSIDSILKYTAENLVGRSLYDLLEEYQNSEYKTYEDKKKGTPSTTTHKEISKLSRESTAASLKSCPMGLTPIIPRTPIFPRQGSKSKRPLTE